jgi:hypothetical protein
MTQAPRTAPPATRHQQRREGGVRQYPFARSTKMTPISAEAADIKLLSRKRRTDLYTRRSTTLVEKVLICGTLFHIRVLTLNCKGEGIDGHGRRVCRDLRREIGDCV